MRMMHGWGRVGAKAVAVSLAVALGACGGSPSTETTATAGATEAAETEAVEATAVTTDAEAGQTYTATVKDDQGDPVADVGVAFCGAGMCNIAYTDENGVATYQGDLPDLEVHIAIPPEGYAENTESLTAESDLAFTLQRQ